MDVGGPTGSVVELQTSEMKLPVSQLHKYVFHWGRNTPGVSQTQIEMSVDEPVAIFEAAITRAHVYLEENQIYFGSSRFRIGPFLI